MVAAVTIAATVIPVQAANAAGCSAAFEPYSSSREAGWGKSECSFGIQRLVLICWNQISQYKYVVNGPWRGPDQQSIAECHRYNSAIAANYER